VSPVDGFEEVATFELAPRTGRQELPVGRDVRFVKVRILETFGGRRTRLNELEVIEGRRPDYISVLKRTAPSAMVAAAGSAAGAGADLPPAGAESEPNDALEQANDLPMGAWTRGAIEPLGESDLYRLPAEVADGRVLSVDLLGLPNIRTSLTLLDAAGRERQSFDPGRLPEERARFSWRLDGDEQFVRVTEPDVSVVLIWDTSGSMQGRTADLERAIRTYIDSAPTSQRLSLIRFSDDVEVLLPGFTKDKEALRRALHGKIGARGGTRFYDAVEEGIRLLRGAGGNRAVVVMTDGGDTGSRLGHAGFWQLLEQERVRLYLVGLGDDMRDYLPWFGATGEQILRHAALATNGRLLPAAASADLHGAYAAIAAELHQPSAYYVRPELAFADGRLEVVSTGQRIARVAPPEVELILDASGSMIEKRHRVNGRLKLDVAKDVLRQALNTVPDGSRVALRVYGRRVREGRPGDCEDTELLLPMGPVDRARMLRAVDQIKGLGTTPIAYALQQAAADFSSAPGEKILVLVTDGMDALGGEDVAADRQDQRHGGRGRGADPVGQGRDVDLDALAGIDRALPVQRQVVPVLGDQHQRQQVGAGTAAGDRVGRCRRLGDRLAAAAA
jgi:Mg-chelatase subunit ChlD